MITKPVSKIFNVYNGTPILTAYDSTKKDREGILKHLAAGQIAFIDTKTNEAVDPSSATFTNPVDIFYRGNDEPVYIHKHPGSKSIMKSDLHNVNLQLAEDGAPFVALIKDFNYCCDGEYGFRFVIKNAELDKLFWPNGYYETYMVDNNECCSACGATTNDESANIIYLTLYKKIMGMHKSKDSLLKPSLIAVTAASGDDPESYDIAQVDGVDVDSSYEDYKKLTLDNFSDTTLALFVEVDDATAWPYSQFNFKYTHIRSTKFEIGRIAGSKCGGKITTTGDDDYSYTPEDAGQSIDEAGDITIGTTVYKPFAMPQTYGYDLKAVEYQLMGYRENMSPYRLSDVTMTEFGYNYSFNDNDKYIVLTINYEKESDAATVHMPYPMSLVLTFASSKASDAENVVKFLTGVTVTDSANINLK